jgi:FKBP-type peptidyl-prolyl cis-trans isomerase FklB
MKKTVLALTTLAAVAAAPLVMAQAVKPPGAPAAAPAPPIPADLKDTSAQVSYAIGLNLGVKFRKDAVAIDPQIMAQGVKDGLTNATPRLTDDQMRAAVTALQASIQEKQKAAAAQASAANAAQGAAFLKTNSAKSGVVTLPSGLQYQILKAGTGPTPKLDDTVVCNYRGATIDGAEFDSSYKRGEPTSFPVSGVIKGWTQALQLMPVGSKWRLFVPADLAYGDKGAGDVIGPGAVLVFEVELVSIAPKTS